MNISILRYSLFGIAGGQEVDHSFVKFIVYPLTMIALSKHLFSACKSRQRFHFKNIKKQENNFF